MGAPDTTQLSSNWKKLQQTLNTDRKPPQPDGNALKRKRPLSKTPTTTFKRTKPSPLHATRKRAMGILTSTPTASSTPSTPSIPSTPRSKIGKYISLDCEMVGTGPPPHTDNILARASLVNYHNEPLYDTYVLPPPSTPIHDYRTPISGILPSHLRPPHAKPFPEVQADIRSLLKGRILVGHALRHDLRVLGLGHPSQDVRDTSRYGKFRARSGGRTPGLRRLVREELGVEIQGGAHSSVEDAGAAMLLFRKEKGGMEEEVRRRFGGGRRRVGGEGVEEVEGEEEEDAGGDEEEDAGGDEEEDEEEEETGRAAQGKAKKRKKKKRTKRK